jgi:K+-sensing histidine kinase KdpD
VRDESALAVGYVVAGLGPLTAVSVLSPLRDEPLSTGIVVLVLVALIGAAAVLAGPQAGAITTVTAVLSFDFLMVPPYGVLSFGSDPELWVVVLLVVCGVAIVVATARRRRSHPVGDTTPQPTPRPNASRHVQRVVLLIEQGADARDLISAVQAELTGLLLARSCRFEAGHDTSIRPCIERDGSVTGWGATLELPATELDLPVRLGRHVVGRFVIEPTAGAAVPLDHRIVAVIVTDHLAAALSGAKPIVPPRA